MNKLEILLENLNILDQVKILKNASLNEVIVKDDDSYVFNIVSDQIIPVDEFLLLQRNKDNFRFPCHINIHYNCKIDKDSFDNYQEYIISLIKDRFPLASNLSTKSLIFENNICKIELINEIQLEQFKTEKKNIESLLKNIGFDIQIELFFDKDNVAYKEMMKEMEAYKPVEIDLSTIKKPKPQTYEKGSNNFYRKKSGSVSFKLNEIEYNTQERNAQIEGYIFKTDMIKTKAGKHIQTLWITDYTDSIMVKRFENDKNNSLKDMNSIKKGKCWIKAIGEIKEDSFAREVIMMARNIEIIKGPQPRRDDAPEKRVELHVHSKMSTMDGVNNISDYINQAAAWGHKAIAVTDHGNVQAFPEAQGAAAKAKIKMIYGIELNMVDPTMDIVQNEKDTSIENSTYVSFDLETTGLSFYHDKITEFGAVKLRNGEVIDTLQSFINPEQEIPTRITNLTNITNDDVKNAPTIQEFLPKILEFFGDSILCAHNARFDIGFLNTALKRCGMDSIKNPIIDSLALSRAMIPKTMKTYRLGAICRYYHIAYDEEVAHRADYDAEVLGNVLNMMIHELMQSEKYNLLDLNKIPQEDAFKLVFPTHVTALAINKAGLKNMFKMVSEANTTYLFREARIPKERLEFYHEGMLYGSSCYNSDIFEACLNNSDEELERLIDFYDYIEIQPLDDYYHLIERGVISNNENLVKSIKRLIRVAQKHNKIIVATGDCHFLDPKDKIYRDVYISNLNCGIGGRSHPLANRNNPNSVKPDQYFRSTEEMLKAYPYLDEDEVYEYVVTNTNKIADMIEEIKPIHDKLFTPTLDNSDENLEKLCYENAHRIYGEQLPQIVESRLKKELDNIIKHGFGVIYYIAHKLVKRSNDDGYLVGSRGSVGSSFVATMADITEVNPLPPHYICPNCQHSEFLDEGVIADGYDLEDKECPICHQPMKGEGHNIPFETFLGFNADKVPDIDLNFSGAYQAKAHAFTKEIFGEDKVFRAGTISTVAEKTAYGYARGYAERMGRDSSIRGAELERIAAGCSGVKRTTGQHPGGIIVIPRDMDVYDFTPYQFPADDLDAEWKTTHFDFHAIHDNVLKFDILGHVDPTVIRELQDLTGVDPKTIPTNDKKVMSLFTSSEALGCDLSYINCYDGALGLPEFGTTFVRSMLSQTKPKSFNDLVIISGLSHGTDVYLGNAETLIKNGVCTLSEVIGCRDDIMVYLIEKGLPNKDAFDIMEVVRKGRSLEVFPVKEYEKLMKDYDVPQWYIDSCKKIKYMFPKAHAVAYVLSAIRVAWWKVYYPREYYAVYFTTRCDFYEIGTLIKGKDAILSRKKEIEALKAERKSSNKENTLLDIFDIALEMIERGYHFNKISLEKSDATKFILDEDDPMGILPPFMCVDSLGEAVANTVVTARNVQPFISKEDVIKRTKLSNTHIGILSQMGVFDGMDEENQLKLF